MSEERWPKKIWEWTPHGRRRRGRPRRTWSNIKEAMAARDLDEQDIQDRSRWRRGCEKRRTLDEEEEEEEEEETELCIIYFTAVSTEDCVAFNGAVTCE
jgi:hypothetical protein